jgi:hypothetical protein
MKIRGNCRHCGYSIVLRDEREGDIHANGKYACPGGKKVKTVAEVGGR